MLGQSKNAFQAEIDCVCELADFYRFNVKNMYDLYHMQPNSSAGIWDRTVWRPLEGFVFALTPFNFTSIAGNLPGAPALMGNVCVWKPSKTAVYSAYIVMKILQEAGLPDGVINLVYCSGPTASDVIFSNKDFAVFISPVLPEYSMTSGLLSLKTSVNIVLIHVSSVKPEVKIMFLPTRQLKHYR